MSEFFAKYGGAIAFFFGMIAVWVILEELARWSEARQQSRKQSQER